MRRVEGPADAIVKYVRGVFDDAIPTDFVRGRDRWTRENDGVRQAIRLSRMRNRSGLDWVTLTIYLDVYPGALSREDGLIPRFRDPPSRSGRDDGFGDNFRVDDPPEVIERKATWMRDELPQCLRYLDGTFGEDKYLAAVYGRAAGFVRDSPRPRDLSLMLAFQRRGDVALCLERMEWAPRPELWSAGWYSDLELAETVLSAYEFLGERPSARWIDMVEQSIAVLNGKPSKQYGDLYRRVAEKLATLEATA